MVTLTAFAKIVGAVLDPKNFAPKPVAPNFAPSVGAKKGAAALSASIPPGPLTKSLAPLTTFLNALSKNPILS